MQIVLKTLPNVCKNSWSVCLYVFHPHFQQCDRWMRKKFKMTVAVTTVSMFELKGTTMSKAPAEDNVLTSTTMIKQNIIVSLCGIWSAL